MGVMTLSGLIYLTEVPERTCRRLAEDWSDVVPNCRFTTRSQRCCGQNILMGSSIIQHHILHNFWTVYIVRYSHWCQHYRFRAQTRAFLAPSRFSLKMSRFLAYFELEKMRSVQHQVHDSATSIQCSAKLIRSARSATYRYNHQ